ncbi:hypothetical protein [Nannocystis bainbridge]|uniref:Uncharacterized protein n=1 Tax=Nannocystis bainbridge TaxID=2995303 RepID=A0ABT5E7E7_9BACT|nr:hypothetical protein [Nannocystis bainbridge]MDC0721784.1 hypothetical protein [Nannocystis bainbridge]
MYGLDLADLAITEIATTGATPGWIYGHSAVLADEGRTIVVSRGKRLDEHHASHENIDDWRLDLSTWRWQRLTERRWPRRELRRADGQRNCLSDLQEAQWMRGTSLVPELGALLEKLERDLGVVPDLDLVARLFRPSVAHEALPEADGPFNVVRIVVASVVVRFVHESYALQMTVEGDLPLATVDAIAEELRARLSTLQHTDWTLTPIGA